MSVLAQLASALGRNDERPNVELAERLARTADARAIGELVAALRQGPTAVQNDALKVLAELGARRPELVAPHLDAFVGMLASPNNRNVWGALQTIDTVTRARPAEVLAALPQIIAAADRSSVIAKDKTMSILSRLALEGHADRTGPILLERLAGAAPNQFPKYAELTLPAVDGAQRRQRLAAILEQRLKGISAPAKRKRVEQVLKRLGAAG